MYYKRLKELREDNDLTQRELCEIIKMKQPQYARYENGNREIPVSLLRKLCLIYKVSADYILELPKELKNNR